MEGTGGCRPAGAVTEPFAWGIDSWIFSIPWLASCRLSCSHLLVSCSAILQKYKDAYEKSIEQWREDMAEYTKNNPAVSGDEDDDGSPVKVRRTSRFG